MVGLGQKLKKGISEAKLVLRMLLTNFCDVFNGIKFFDTGSSHVQAIGVLTLDLLFIISIRKLIQAFLFSLFLV